MVSRRTKPGIGVRRGRQRRLESIMAPRPSWNGYLRLSLVSCPISLSPATSETARISLHQINPETGNRVRQRLVDEATGEDVERSSLIRGYEVAKGQYVTVTRDELDELKIESSEILDLKTFVDRSKVDPLYIDTPYFVYPGKGGEDAYRVIAVAMEQQKRVAIGRIVLSTHEHPVMVEPFLGGLLMTTLRAANEVREPDYDFKDKPDAEMVSLAKDIMKKFEGDWEPETFRDEYQDALRALLESKQKGQPLKKAAAAPARDNVIDLMAALKRSIAGAGPERPAKAANSKAKTRAKKQDKRQASMLLPIKGKGEAQEKAKAAPARKRRAS
jgi:DNA end-binding protein Ku